MIWRLWLLLWVAGAIAFGTALVTRRGVAPLSLVAMLFHATAALQARNLTILHRDGTSTAAGSEPVQWLTAVLALIETAALVSAVWWGSFPRGDEEIPEPQGVD